MMQPKKVSLWQSITGWSMKCLVLVVLAGIGWWGHHTHWTLPGLGASGEHQQPGAPQSDQALPSEPKPEFPGRLPIIAFDSEQAARNCGIMTESAHTRIMGDVISAAGRIGFDEAHVAQLATRVPGSIWKVQKRLGDVVKRGDVLAIVDSTEVGQAKAALLESMLVYDLKSRTVARLEQVTGTVSRREVQEAIAAREVASVQRFNAAQKLVNFGFSVDLEQISKLSTEEVRDYVHFLGVPKELTEGTNSANLIPLVAPFDGVITQSNLARGEVVDPTTHHYTIADMRRMWIHLDVRLEDAPRLKLGATAIVRSEGDQDPILCSITWIGAEVDSKTRTIQARAEADNPIEQKQSGEHSAVRRLRANAYCSAEIRVDKDPHKMVVVNNDALHWVWEIGKQIVFVSLPDHKRFEPRIVTKGLVRDGLVQIIDGIKPGEKVATAGSRILASELSERLQAHIGENAEAVRYFGESKSSVSEIE